MKSLVEFIVRMLQGWNILPTPTWKLSVSKGYGQFHKGVEQFPCMFSSRRVGRSVLDTMFKQEQITVEERAALDRQIDRAKLPEEAPNDFRVAAFSTALFGRPSFGRMRALMPLK